MKTCSRVFVFCSLLLGISVTGVAETGFVPGFSEYSIQFGTIVIPYKEFAVFVLPSATFPVRILQGKKQFYLLDSKKIVKATGFNRWVWQAPDKKGNVNLLLVDEEGILQVTLNVFVMVPFHQLRKGYLNGFRIGNYPTDLYRNLSIYKTPRGFIEITDQNRQTRVSPHFHLEQFLCKQKEDYPHYIVLKEQLILKLELILQTVNRRGYHCSELKVMSGYRTPFYNRNIGNVKYSRHIWGGAADIFIDENPKDRMMDDLNRDGRSDYLDADILYQIVDELPDEYLKGGLSGGLGRYKKSAFHGPFIHVDVRGFRVRWGS